MTVTLVTALLFSSMYGVGAAIAIGVIAYRSCWARAFRLTSPRPHSPWESAPVRSSIWFNSERFKKLFPGLKYEAPYLTFWAVGMGVYIAGGMAYELLLSAPERCVRRMASTSTSPEPAQRAGRKRTPYYTYIVPIVPGAHDHDLQVARFIPTFMSQHRARTGADLAGSHASGPRQSVQQDILPTPFPISPRSPRCGRSAA